MADGAEGIAEEAEGDEEEEPHPPDGTVPPEEGGGKAQHQEGHPGGKDQGALPEEGEAPVEKAVPRFVPVGVPRVQEEGEPSPADLPEVAEVHLVVHPHRRGPKDRQPQHGGEGDPVEDGVGGPGGGPAAEEDPRQGGDCGQEEIGGHGLPPFPGRTG